MGLDKQGPIVTARQLNAARKVARTLRKEGIIEGNLRELTSKVNFVELEKKLRRDNFNVPMDVQNCFDRIGERPSTEQIERCLNELNVGSDRISRNDNLTINITSRSVERCLDSGEFRQADSAIRELRLASNHVSEVVVFRSEGNPLTGLARAASFLQNAATNIRNPETARNVQHASEKVREFRGQFQKAGDITKSEEEELFQLSMSFRGLALQLEKDRADVAFECLIRERSV